jgi:hypothetical protein
MIAALQDIDGIIKAVAIERLRSEGGIDGRTARGIASQQVTMDAKDSPHCKKERKEPILRIPETGRVLRGTLTEKRHSTYCITLPSILAVRCNEAWPE